VTEEIDELFANIRTFEWDPPKRERILKEREIDFEDARFVIDGQTIIRRSDRKGETRYMIFGFLNNVEVVVVCTIRATVCRIISARRARRDEREKYHSHIPRRSAEGQD
jgi:uncharacterized DUF497 family protein